MASWSTMNPWSMTLARPGTPTTGMTTGPNFQSPYTGIDPQIYGIHNFINAKDWLQNNPGIWDPYTGQMTAGQTGAQTQATSAASGLLGFTPANVRAQQATAGRAEYAGDVAAQNVTAGSFLGSDIGAYLNPYTSNVVDVALGDLERQRQIANQQGARSAGASTYGGSRNALIEAETNRGFADASARTAAQLRSQGFDTAAGLLGQDLSRQFQAGLANQGANLQAGLANQATLQGANQFNAGQFTNASLANAQLRQQAGLANQQAGLAGAGLNLQAAGQLYGMGTQQQMAQQAGLDRQFQEYLRSTYGPMQGYNFLGGLLGGTPYQPQPQGPGGLGVGQGALAGASIGATFGPWGAGIGAGLGALGGLIF